MTTQTANPTTNPFGFEAPEEHLEQAHSSYPVMQWLKGSRLLATKRGMQDDPQAAGGFFAKSANWDEAPGAGWQETEITFENGGSEGGYSIRVLRVAILGTQQHWIHDIDGKTTVSSKYEVINGEKPKGRLRALVVSPDVTRKGEMIPFVITFGGMAGKGLSDRNEGILAHIDNFLIQPAFKITKVRLPRYAFWVTIHGKRDANGKPLFEEVGKAGATSPIIKPDAPDLTTPAESLDDIMKHYVGQENAEKFAFLRTAAEQAGWFEEWNGDASQHDQDDADQSRSNGRSSSSDSTSYSKNGIKMVTDAQINYLQGLARKLKIDYREIENYAADTFGRALDDLSSSQASDVISHFKEYLAAGTPAGKAASNGTYARAGSRNDDPPF